MALTLYVSAPTLLHRLHPLTKIIALVAFIVAAFMVDRPVLQLPLAAAVAALVVAGRGLPNVRRFRLMFVLVFGFTLLVWTFFYGTVFMPTHAGFLFGLSTAIRLSTFLATGIVFLTTTRIEEIAYGLGCLRVPIWVYRADPVRASRRLTVVWISVVPYTVGFTLTLAFRLVPVFFDSALTIVQAQRCRGLEFGRGGVVTRLRRFVPVIVPVFIGALRRADRMAMALELRGFNSGRPRTTYLRAQAGPADWVAGALAVATAALYVALWARGLGTLAG